MLTFKTNGLKCLFSFFRILNMNIYQCTNFVKKIIIRIFTSENLLSVNRNYSGGPVKARNEVRAAACHQSGGCVASQSH